MKIHKIILTIAVLTLFTNVLPKVYFSHKGEKLFNGKDFPVLDICIFLDKYWNDTTHRRWKYNSELIKDPILNVLIKSIEQEEASVSSSIFMSGLINSIPRYEKDEFPEKYENLIRNLNDQNKWLKLMTKDNEFVVLIPKKKYPNIKTIEDLEKIGIEKGNLEEFKSIPRSKDDVFYKTIKNAVQKRIEKIETSKEISDLQIPKEKASILKEKGLIKDETLLNLFSASETTKKISKRVYLCGHGLFQEQVQSKEPGAIEIKKPINPIETTAEIAQLRPYQYIKLLKKLTDIGCSWLHVCSCYSGGYNALSCQNNGFYKQKNIFKKFESITEKIPFIIVAESTPDSVGSFTDYNHVHIANFFIEINKFFIKQRESLESYLKLEKISIPNSSTISENDIITGKLVKQKITYKTEENGKTIEKIEENNISLIEQKPWLISSKELREILINVRMLQNENLSSVRFPGLPFFRMTLADKDPDLKKDLELLQKKYEQIGENVSKRYRGKGSSDIYGEILNKIREEEQDEKTKSNIENLKNINKYMIIDYKFLLGRQITGPGKDLKSAEVLKKSKDQEAIKIQEPIIAALVYPSIIDTPIIINDARIESMIPGRAQHFFKSITLEANSSQPKIEINILRRIFPGKDSTKMFFIKRLTGLSDKKEISNLAIKIEKYEESDIYTYIYKNKDGKYYNQDGKILDEKTAKNTIKEWILQTTPAKEAIHEATAGIDNIYKIRIKINQIFKDMFSPEELGKKPSPEQRIIKARQKPAPVPPIKITPVTQTKVQEIKTRTKPAPPIPTKKTITPAAPTKTITQEIKARTKKAPPIPTEKK